MAIIGTVALIGVVIMLLGAAASIPAALVNADRLFLWLIGVTLAGWVIFLLAVAALAISYIPVTW